MTAGHLVTRLNAPLDRKVYLGHLQNAGGEVVARRDLRFFLVEALIELLTLAFQACESLL